jgi:hypothetical protein
MTNRYQRRAVLALPLLGLLTTLALLAVLALAPAGPARADPMKPLVLPGKAPAATAASTPAPALAAAAPRPLGRLVAIRQDSQGRQQALIGERWVSVGDTLDHATVTAIAPNQVDLKSGKTRSTLHLLPPLQATSATATDPAPDRAVLALHDRAPTARPAGSPTR